MRPKVADTAEGKEKPVEQEDPWKHVWERVIKPQPDERYENETRLANVISAIQVMGTHSKPKRHISEWAYFLGAPVENPSKPSKPSKPSIRARIVNRGKTSAGTPASVPADTASPAYFAAAEADASAVNAAAVAKWEQIFAAHPEFFKATEKGSRYRDTHEIKVEKWASLKMGQIDREKPLHITEVSSLMSLAAEIHDRQIARQQEQRDKAQERRWVIAAAAGFSALAAAGVGVYSANINAKAIVRAADIKQRLPQVEKEAKDLRKNNETLNDFVRKSEQKLKQARQKLLEAGIPDGPD